MPINDVASRARRHFEDRCEFFDDVIGVVFLNQLEKDCVESPEFQRLFRISQLGFVRMLYHAANHTRGIHSIGACAKAKLLVEHLNTNTPRILAARANTGRDERALPKITQAESVLISLGGLLHDIPHGPLSHDIEKKTHRFNQGKTKVRSYYGPYDKHDDFFRNPALFVFLLDPGKSILARILREHSVWFWELLKADAASPDGDHLKDFVNAASKADWPDLKREILPQLLFHLLAFEDLDSALAASQLDVATDFAGNRSKWGLGPETATDALHQAWYQPYRHDVVGDTLSADLLDYLPRDAKRLGMQSSFDGKLLEYYVLVDVPPDQLANGAVRFKDLVRCAIDLNDYKRGVLRSERINDIFRLLDFRHEIHEKAVYHRVVQAAIAMAARAIALAGDNKPAVESLYGFGAPLHALYGDDHLLQRLASPPTTKPASRNLHSLAQKLVERRIYRPLMIIPGDQAYRLISAKDQNDEHETMAIQEERLRQLGAIIDSTYFAPLFCTVCWCVERLLDHSLDSMESLSRFVRTKLSEDSFLNWAGAVMPRRVIMWATPYKQLYKDPGIVVRANDLVDRIDVLASATYRHRLQVPRSLRERLRHGLADSESRYAAMWKIYVFISDGLYYSGGVARLMPDHPCRVEPTQNHAAHLRDAQHCLLRAIREAFKWWNDHREGIDLDQRITGDDLRQLFDRYLFEEKFYVAKQAEELKTVSAVDVTHYLHGEPDSSCRDIRYRFDRDVDLERAMDEAGVPKTLLPAVKAFFENLGLNYREWNHEEVVDVVSRYGPRLGELVKTKVANAARRGATYTEESLREVWLSAEWDLAAVSTTRQPNGDEGVSARVSAAARSFRSVDSGGPDRGDGRGGVASGGLFEGSDTSVDSGGNLPDSTDARSEDE